MRRRRKIITYLDTTSSPTPNTPELIMPGRLPMEARLEKYSSTRVMWPEGYMFTSIF